MNLFKGLLGLPYSMAAESQESVVQEAGRGNSQYHETRAWKPAQHPWCHILLISHRVCPGVLTVKPVGFLFYFFIEVWLLYNII